ncbi:MAG TPA: acetyl-CoA carboxylase biotin carboxylase subunit, partial [Candidatus Thermoplasmatota archaeon]|nr:acetyl-CoA carboxylase biotin carboxylase subunit [Candidatus Thermoplasmatota archaeon]
MFRTLLVANRGEIACRVIRACRELGVRAVAVYSDADANALHVRLADEAVRLGPAPSAESYLAMDRVLDAARRSGAQAVHPGYGFLSENAEFASLCEKAGIVFVGPPSSAMAQMGDKLRAKALAREAGVPVAPGSTEPVEDPSEVARIAREVGLPVLLKAARGGGGRGQRIVRREDEIEEAIAACRQEAQSAFGSSAVFVEKFVENPRHIEFQVLADAHGHVLHFGERECSIQRRNQKLVEEAPSPIVTEAIRREMGEKVVALARRVGYVNAGTMEFLWKDGRFHFMEMNTRLQVEHPVTEMVYGVDLVRWQLRIASGEELTIRQEDIRPRGHAIEFRVNAEDPYRALSPSPGLVADWRPPEGEGVRTDAGVYPGFVVPSAYDSLLAKLVVWDNDRAAAIERATRALGAFHVGSTTTNLPFHRAVVGLEAFRRG